MSIRLNKNNLPQIPKKVPIPRYDPRQISPGILHFGVGNFHRAHQIFYLDRLFNKGLGLDWGVVGASVMEHDQIIREKLAAQDNLSTLVEQSADLSAARITGAMVDFLPVKDSQATLKVLLDPAIRIVSLTITEGGYFVNPATDMFDATYREIVEDAKNPNDPQTVFGIILASLKARRKAGIEPFTVMSCDNLPHNGVVTRNTVVGLARLSDPDLADWIFEQVAFPNSMVDRITPATGEREREIILKDFGIEDSCPVFCEDFSQWVLEDNFSAGRPPLDMAGVQFVEDVSPYELMKIRILNGGHAVIAYPAGLLGIHYVHEAMANPLIKGFLEKLERMEIIPAVPPVPGTDLNAYFDTIKMRFENPKIGDTVKRLCLDGSNRQPKFIIPSIADRLQAGQDISGLALVSALWCRYCFGETQSGAPIDPNDPDWDHLVGVARQAKTQPIAWLSMAEIYGDLVGSTVFVQAFEMALNDVWRDGVEAVLRRYLGEA